MKTPLRRFLSLAAATSVVVAGSALAAPAHAVPDDGKGNLTVKVVDFAGKPLVSGLSVASSSGDGAGGLFGETAASTHLLEDLDVGRYGMYAMAPWSGIFCAGLTPCDVTTFAGTTEPNVTGVVDVVDVETPSTYTLKAPRPATIVGQQKVGSTLAVQYSQAMSNLSVLTGPGGGISIQWLRNGAVIPGAINATYVTSAADAGKVVAARLSYSAPYAAQFAMYGMNAAPLTVSGPKVTRAQTRTTASLFRNTITADRTTSVRIDVTSGGEAATGRVKIKIGSWAVTKGLRNGSARTVLPKLKPGTYQVQALFQGSQQYAPSKAKATLRVRPKK